MEVTAITRNFRMSAFKGRALAREVQGKPVPVALNVLTFHPSKGAVVMLKTLKSAMANAKNNNNLEPETMLVKLAVFDESKRMRRYWAAARGSARPIARRLCHCKIVLTDAGLKAKA
ncbi:MAG: 50S ribosomal protein L22 [Kiritimatiellae bacterium]|nr:50S ribosomal protein L22 [Kiritimatiellia bacterium]